MNPRPRCLLHCLRRPLNIILPRPRQQRDLRPAHSLGNRQDRRKVAIGGNRETCLENVDTEVSQRMRQRQLLSGASCCIPATVRHPATLYRKSKCVLILGFMLLGKSLEARAKRRALAALDSLSRLRPATARRIANGVQTVVPLEEIRTRRQHTGAARRAVPGRRNYSRRPHHGG